MHQPITLSPIIEVAWRGQDPSMSDGARSQISGVCAMVDESFIDEKTQSKTSLIQVFLPLSLIVTNHCLSFGPTSRV